MDGYEIAERMNIDEGAGVWILGDCVVTEIPNDHDLHAFAVYMATENGSIVRQDVLPGSIEEMEENRQALDDGEAPTDGWEDGLGNTVCPENGEIVDGGYSVVQGSGNVEETAYYATAEEAVAEAESDWNHLTDGDRVRYSDRTVGARFEVLDRDGRVIRDLAEDFRLASERQRLGSRCFGDLDECNRQIDATARRLGQEFVDWGLALNEGGWDGSETVGELLGQYEEMTSEQANDMLDLLTVLHAMDETEEDE